VAFEQPQSQRATKPSRTGRARASRAGMLLVRVLLDLLLIDAAVETWLSGTPVRVWVVAAVAVYVALTLWALAQGSRLAAPGLVTQTPAPFYLLLGLLGAITLDQGGFTHGLVMLKQPTPVVLTSVTLILIWLAVFRVAVLRGAWLWFRLLVVGLGIYATYACVTGILHGMSYWDLLRGRGEWQRLPYWGQGAVVGALGLVPLGFIRELGVSMARAVLTGYFRWMLVFGLGAWIAINAVSN
jgi:hypothetical protein